MYEPVSIVQPSSAARNALRSADDRRDGFIHLSGTDQVVETAWRHFAGQTELVLLAVDPDRLREDLRWEPSRGGAFFPMCTGRCQRTPSWPCTRYPMTARRGGGGRASELNDKQS